MEFNNITVVGGGTMGNGIAHIFAQKGFHVNLVEMSEELVRKAITTIAGNLERQLKKQLIDEKSKIDTLARISPIVGTENTPIDSDLVIEAIYENKSAKILLFNQLKTIVKQESIFASNTSSISITELASASRPEKFIGMHFMNPVPVMKLIEIIRGYSTSDMTFNSIKELSLKIDKVPVEVHDYPGFISNRILMPKINEAN